MVMYTRSYFSSLLFTIRGELEKAPTNQKGNLKTKTKLTNQRGMYNSKTKMVICLPKNGREIKTA